MGFVVHAHRFAHKVGNVSLTPSARTRPRAPAASPSPSRRPPPAWPCSLGAHSPRAHRSPSLPVDPPPRAPASVRKVLPRRAQRGSGLGLAILRSIAERHAGKVWLESQLGQGSTIFLLIPYEQP